MSRLFFGSLQHETSLVLIKEPGCQWRQIYWAQLEMRVSLPLPSGLVHITLPAKANLFDCNFARPFTYNDPPACTSMCALLRSKRSKEHQITIITCPEHTDVSSRSLNIKPGCIFLNLVYLKPREWNISRTSSPPKKVASSSRTTERRPHLEVHDLDNKTKFNVTVDAPVFTNTCILQFILYLYNIL